MSSYNYADIFLVQQVLENQKRTA